jgi:hypothetical protein
VQAAGDVYEDIGMDAFEDASFEADTMDNSL